LFLKNAKVVLQPLQLSSANVRWNWTGVWTAIGEMFSVSGRTDYFCSK